MQANFFNVIFAFNPEIKNKERLQLKFNTTASVVRRKQLLMEARDASMIYVYLPQDRLVISSQYELKQSTKRYDPVDV